MVNVIVHELYLSTGGKNTHLRLLALKGTRDYFPVSETIAFLIPGCASSQGVRHQLLGGGAQLGSGLMLGLLAIWLTFPDSKV